MTSPSSRIVQISGITTHINDCLKHPLLVKITVDHTKITSVLLKRKLKHVGTHSFGRHINISEGSTLTIQIQEKRHEQNDKILALLKLSLDEIWPGQAPGTSEGQNQKYSDYQIHLNDPRKQIWLNINTFPPTSQVDSNNTGSSAVRIDPHITAQELNELKDYLLEGTKKVDPRAVECIPGTRTKILADVAAKTDDCDDTNMIWIRGAPGTGKSSVSLSAKSWLRAQGRLVTYFRFDRNEASTTTPAVLWRHVAYGLARRLPLIRTRLLHQVRDDKVDLESPMAVFTSLVEDPLSKLTVLPVDRSFVVVIDALDECGGFVGHLSPERQVLLQTLRQWPQLPKHFKLLVTSREEGDITRALSPISTPIYIPSGRPLTDYPQSEASIHASNDIRIFLEGRFQQVVERIPSLPRDWPGTKTISDMVCRATGIFMWATATMNFIDCRAIDPKGRLRKVMSDLSESIGMKPLYSLYIAILETSFGDISSGDSEAEVLRSVLGTIVLAKRPLHDIEYTKLPTTEAVRQDTLDCIRDGLHSVLVPGTLRFIHKSFDDFLLSEECPPKYRICIEESQYLLSRLCLTTMIDELRFNICNLGTSCLKNADVPDIGTKVAENIPSLLSYACCFWADHLVCTPFDEQWLFLVKTMILDKLLYWFEAMSLLGETNRISHSLLSILKWSHVRIFSEYLKSLFEILGQPSPDDEFKEFLRDARRFVGFFGLVIAESAPHIYISALPFAPEHSLIAKHFLPQFPWTLALSTGKPTHWPTCIFVSGHHKGAVQAVAISPDERYFVSVSLDGTICICDYATGNLFSSPFHAGSEIEHIFFDLDGRQVWTLDCEERVVGWDLGTGKAQLKFRARDVIGSCRFGNDHNIISVSRNQGTVTLWSADTGKRLHNLPIDIGFDWLILSPNGNYIAGLGREDTIVEIWELVDGDEVRLIRKTRDEPPRFKHSKPVSALCFSVDNSFAVSGSEDSSILIWDTRTGDTVGPPLVTGSGEIDAVGFSYKNGLLVSVSESNTVMVWNASTHEKVLGPLEGHTDWITSIALSRDGRSALTSSLDGMVRKWDLGMKGATPVIEHNSRGHSGWVRCFTFSPCGKILASLGGDEMIHFWDVNTGKSLPINPIVLSYYYFRIIFSPDGGQIMAYRSLGSDVQAWTVPGGDLIFHHHFRDDREANTHVHHVAFRSTDQHLVISSTSGVVCIWGEEGPAAHVVAKLPDILALSPDGLTAVVHDNNANPRLYLWSTTTFQPLPITFADNELVSENPRAYYSPNGKYIAVICETYMPDARTKSTLQVWSTQLGGLAVASSSLDGKIYCLAISPNDNLIAFSYYSYGRYNSTTIWFWGFCTGRLVPGFWNGHVSDVTALVFSPDGEKLVLGSKNGQIRIWTTAIVLDGLYLHGGIVDSGLRIQDGWIVDADGRLRFWVPEDHREKLVWNGNVAVIGGRYPGITTQVDLTRFRYGEKWVGCAGGGK